MLNDKRSYMKKERTLHTTITLLLCGLLLYACTSDDLVHDVTEIKNEILFQTEEVTRALVDNLAGEGTKVCIYGYHDNNILASGQTYPLAGKSLTYMNGGWAVVDNDTDNRPVTYYWEGGGTYKFFGWLKRDATGLGAPSNDWTAIYDDTNKSLTVNATLGSDYNQFDFLYSGIDYRVMTDAQMDRRTVEMNMNHLFSTFAIGFINKSNLSVTINSVVLYGICDNGSAVIDFSPNSANNIVSYGLPSIRDVETPYVNNSTGYDVAANDTIANVFDRNAAQQYYLVWPQNITGAYLTLNYSIEGEDDPTLKTIQLPDDQWEAGKKNTYNILFESFGITIETTSWEKPKINDVIIVPSNNNNTQN